MNNFPNTEIAFIYGLSDPETKEIRYVGKSINPNERYESHVYYEKNPKTYKATWINSLKVKNLLPKLVILEIVKLDEWEAKEKNWIKKLKTNGERLTNLTEGGQCTAGQIQKVGRVYRRIKKLPLNGRKLSESVKKKVSVGLKKYWASLSPEEKDKQLKKIHGARKFSEEYRRKISEASRGVKRKNSSSKYMGVSWIKKDKRWIAYLVIHRKRICFGYFKDELDAAKAFNNNAPRYLGDKCKLNQI